MVIFIFYFLDWTYPFWVNLAQKFKIVSLSSNLAPTLFRKYKVRWRCSFFLFQTFFCKLYLKNAFGVLLLTPNSLIAEA